MKGIYIVGSYPDFKSFVKQLEIIAESNIDFIEIGLPFNDPVADGPVIAKAANEIANKGYEIDAILEQVDMKLKNKKVYVMTYSNVIFNYGVKNFSEKYKEKVKGLIIADLPNRMHSFFYKLGLTIPIIPFLTLETREKDIELIKKLKGDFIYFIGIRGTTGGDIDFNNSEIEFFLAKVKKRLKKSIVFGFGIKKREDIEKIMKFSDGYVIGTEIVKRQRNLETLRKFLNIIQ